MEMERVFVTGGSGFVGLNVVEALLSAGVDVTSFDAKTMPQAALETFQHLPGRLTTIEGDIRDLQALLMAAQTTDAIVHGTTITPNDANEAATVDLALSINVGGTINALRAAALTSRRRMVFLSSASVYGAAELTGGLLDEAASAPAPRSVYAVSKFAAERLAERLAPQDAISLRLLRLGSVFGPWEHATGVRATLSPIFQTTGIAVSGSGSCVLPREGRRDWIYSRDVAAAVLRAVIADEATPGPVNIGLGHEWTVADWCDRLARRFAGFSYRLSAGGEVATIDFHGAADRAALAIDRLHGSLAFQPNYGLEAAFDDYMGWIGAHPQFLEGCGDGRL